MLEEYNYRLKEGDNEYVDIHGRDIPSVIIKKTGEVAFPLNELRQTGVAIYQKSQYAKLSTVTKQFDDDFHTYMLESAKRFMLMNKIPFAEEQILKSIINCKNVLSQNKKGPSPQSFLNNRVVAEKGNEILIQVPNVPTSAQSPTPNPKRRTFPIKTLVTPKKITFKDPEPVDNIAPTPKTPSEDVNTQPTQSEAPTRRLRPPKTKILERAVLDEKKQVEYEVLVTCIDKRNCIWVRDKANSELFQTVHKMVNEEAQFQPPASKPWYLEKVYMTSDEDSWFRCKITRFSPLTVFFLDYGNVAEVETLKMVSEELAKIPCMAVRLTFLENEYVPDLEDEITVKILKQNGDGTYFVNVLRDSSSDAEKENATVESFSGIKEEIDRNIDRTRETSSAAKMNPKRNEEVSTKQDLDTKTSKEEYEAFPKFYKRPPRLCSLEDEQRVVIIHEERGVLYLRTRECYQKLKSITEAIEEEVQWTDPVERVDANQLVLVLEDGKYHRAVVLKLIRGKIQVEYLDHVKKAIVSLDDVVNITESLSKEPVTYFQAHKLKGFDELDEECKNVIAEHIQKSTKFLVVLDAEGDFDLSDGSQTLCQQLQALKGATKRVILQDMKRYEPEFGLDSYLCGCFKDSDELSLVPKDILTKNMDSVLIQEMEDTEPYVPVVGEICLSFYLDHWYRSVVTRIIGKELEVLLLDFGNVEFVKKEDIRKISKEMIEIPILALPCRLVELPDHPKLQNLLKTMIIDGEFYNVKVKSISDGKYDVEIPSVYQGIRKTPM